MPFTPERTHPFARHFADTVYTQHLRKGYSLVIAGSHKHVKQGASTHDTVLLITQRKILAHLMTPDEARHLIIEGIHYAAYHETDVSLYDPDKNHLFGSEHYNSGRPVQEQSPWAEGNFEEKMAILLVWAKVLNRSAATFAEAQNLLETEDSILGRIIRGAKARKPADTFPEINTSAKSPEATQPF